jgi:RNA polymerase sigma-70 factor (ECF subfamily)
VITSAAYPQAEVGLEGEQATAISAFDLIRRAQNGDRAAFEQLYRKYSGRVYAVCLRISANAAHAEELTQEAFVRAWQMLATFRGESDFFSWLYRLAVNVVFSDMRSKRRRVSRVMTTDNLSMYDQKSNAGIDGATIDLEKAIAALPKQARAVFVLHDVEGYRHEEIAEMMKLSVGTCKSQLHRARRILREALEA